MTSRLFPPCCQKEDSQRFPRRKHLSSGTTLSTIPSPDTLQTSKPDWRQSSYIEFSYTTSTAYQQLCTANAPELLTCFKNCVKMVSWRWTWRSPFCQNDNRKICSSSKTLPEFIQRQKLTSPFCQLSSLTPKNLKNSLKRNAPKAVRTNPPWSSE